MNQIRNRRGIESESLLRNHGDKTGARLERRIVKLAVALILLEVLGVSGREKRALVVIEPPGDVRRTGVFEIDDRIFVAVELLFIEQRSRAVNQTGELEVDVTADAFSVKAREQRG